MNVLVFGMPGVGKSTLLRRLRATLPGPPHAYLCGLVTAERYDHLLVLGKYEEGVTFAGTDRWSMAVQQDAPRFWEDVATTGYQVVGEGSRIATRPFIDEARKHVPVALVFLWAKPETTEARRAARSNQSPSWVAGMQTRMMRLANAYTDERYFLCNETEDHLEANVHFVQTLLN
jgi:predicted kinase